MKKLGVLGWLGVLVIALVSSSCSDGEYKLGDAPPGLSPVPPSVISFASDKTEINKGESVTLNFEVANADYVEVNGLSADGSFEFQSGQITELNSSVIVDNITATTEFILTATKTTVSEEETPAEAEDGAALVESKTVSVTKLSISRAEGEEETAGEEEEVPAIEDPLATGLTDTASILITVIEHVELDFGIIAEPEAIKSGEKAILRWWAKPETDVATVSITGSDGVAIVAKDVCGTIEEVEAAETSETVPMIGCAVVAPLSTANYIITVTDKVGTEFSANTNLTVEEIVVNTNIEIKSFTVSGESDLLEVESMPKENVLISWDVMPVDAKVEIKTKAPGKDSIIEGALSGCELPTAGEAVGSITCKLEKEADVILIVSIADNKMERAVRARTRTLNQAEVVVEGPAWAFEGEQIEVVIAPKTPADGALVSEVEVEGGDQVNINDVRGGQRTVVNVTAPGGNVNARVRFTNGVENKIPVTSVLSLRGDNLASEISSANILDGKIYYGMKQPFGKAKIVQRDKLTSTVYEIPYESFFVKDRKGVNANLYKIVSRYAVGGVDKASDGSLVVGMSGLVLRQNGDKWEKVRALTFKKKNYPGEHPSCKGDIQTGTKDGKEINGITDVCDVMISGDQLVIATDQGAFWMNNFPSEYGDVNGQKSENETFGMVANDLERVDGTIFVATSAGLINSSGGVYKFTGSGFEAIGSGIAEAYSLSYDGENLIVGAKDGVYKLTLSGEATKLDGVEGPIYAVASSAGVIMAGASDGVVVQRGDKWNHVMSDVLNSDIKALALGEDAGNILVALSGGSNIIDGVASIPNASKTQPAEETPPANQSSLDTLAKCLTAKGAKMYGSLSCGYCIAQKEMFGASFQYIDFIDCGTEEGKKLCSEAGVTGYPTWIINGQKYEGKQTLEKLAELTGCAQ